MNLENLSSIVQAAQGTSVLGAALAYAELGLSVIPLEGKRPSIPWKAFQHHVASQHTIHDWHDAGILHNVGLVCGTVSQNLAVLDLDAPESYKVLKEVFPNLLDTYTIASGSGKGKHLYWYAKKLPPTLRVLKTVLGNLELRTQGCQVVAPPSIHPETHQPYYVERPLPIQTVAHLEELTTWLKTFLSKRAECPIQEVRSFHVSAQRNRAVALNPRVIEVLVTYFEKRGFKAHQEWLNGSCICPHNHQHGDIHPSFGFNWRTGYGHCFICGTFLTKDICQILGIDPNRWGGLLMLT